MPRLLIVDDDPDIRAILSDRLAAQGHEILEAEDGLKAIEVTARAAPDLMLLDLDLPGADGFTVLERLRHDEGAPTVVVITALASIEKAVEAMRAGAYDFIAKPFNPGQVDVVVRKALERAELREENRTLRASLPPVDRRLVGSSPNMQRLVET
ncbi:MAG: response regulator, partial [Candidatus Binatia bacterium]